MKALRARLGAGTGREAGLTLVELLVAAAMSVILVGAACAMLISAVRSQPKLSKKDQNITTARYVLERMTREIRNGKQVYTATGSEVAFETQVRRTSCGGAVEEDPSLPAIDCRVTYRCATASPPTVPTTYSCSRAETDPEVAPGAGTPTTTVVSGLNTNEVFKSEEDEQDKIDFIGITLHIANPEGSGDLMVKDGAGLRTVSYQDSYSN